jgi:hypothetical protein
MGARAAIITEPAPGRMWRSVREQIAAERAAPLLLPQWGPSQPMKALHGPSRSQSRLASLSEVGPCCTLGGTLGRFRGASTNLIKHHVSGVRIICYLLLLRTE